MYSVNVYINELYYYIIIIVVGFYRVVWSKFWVSFFYVLYYIIIYGFEMG